MSRLSKNIAYNLIGQGLMLVLGFISVRYIFKQLGEDALGIIYFTATMNIVLRAILEMGICSTTIREISSHFSSEPNYVRNLVRTFSLFYWFAYIIVGSVIFFLAPVLVDKWINLKTMDAGTATYILRILGISLFLALPNSLYDSLFRGLQRMEFNNIINVATGGLQQLGTILILILGGSLFHVVYWFAACYGIRTLICLTVSSHFFSIRALIPGYSTEVIKRNLGFAARMMCVSIAATIHTQADKAIISKLLPIGVVGYYGFVYSNVSGGQLLTGAVSQAALPSFSALFKAGDRSALMSQYRRLQDLVCFGTAPVFAAVPFAALPLFSYILNEEAARLLLLPATLLCVGFYMNSTLHIPHVFSLAVGKPQISARANIYALPVVLPVTALLIYYLGLTGAGLSWVFYHIFAYSYGVPRVCRECLGIPVWKWYSYVSRIFGLIGLTHGFAWIALSIANKHSLLSLTLAYMGASFVFSIGAYFLMGNELRSFLVRHFRAFGRFA